MTEDDIARLILIASLEGNSRFWSGQVGEFGAPFVVAKIREGGYNSSRQGGEKLQRHLAELPLDMLLTKIDGLHLLTPSSEDWPSALNDLLAPPFALLAAGELEVLSERRIAIVGTRNPTSYGSRIASELASSMVDHGYLVVSGGAFGIDADAHRGALAADGSTIAVLGGGVNQIYPSSHGPLYAAIKASGLLLSEVMPDVRPLPHRFLTRNRIIAALGSGTVVVEAALRSGSIRTARDAAELMRPVMAIPGPITSPTSAGCHALIFERRAELVTSSSEILQLIEPL